MEEEAEEEAEELEVWTRYFCHKKVEEEEASDSTKIVDSASASAFLVFLVCLCTNEIYANKIDLDKAFELQFLPSKHDDAR